MKQLLGSSTSKSVWYFSKECLRFLLRANTRSFWHTTGFRLFSGANITRYNGSTDFYLSQQISMIKGKTWFTLILKGG